MEPRLRMRRKSGLGRERKLNELLTFTPPGLGQSCPQHCPRLTETQSLGRPLSIREVSHLIGCSPWTVRQTLIPRGLPYLRFTASGRLTFFENQVNRWIENQQGGGQ